MTTDYQKGAVNLCTQLLDVTFEGDIENEQEVQEFLDAHLEDAEALYNELKCEYEAAYL